MAALLQNFVFPDLFRLRLRETHEIVKLLLECINRVWFHDALKQS